MSVMIESQLDDPIVIISNFVVCEIKVDFNWAQSREFKIGDVVYFVDYYKDSEQTQDFISWKIVFRDELGKLYSAVQSYFITKETWNDIVEYLQRR